MRRILLLAAISLTACSPPASKAPETPAPPNVVACNTVTPDTTKQVAIGEPVAVAALASELRGGPIAPGLYDLVSANRVGAATGWDGTRAVTLDVSEDSGGATIFNWAGAPPAGEADRWTATFTDATPAHLAYTCGRMGEVEASFSASANDLRLQVPDGANGGLYMTFQRRS